MPFTTAATDVEAELTSLSVASDPDERPAPVRVRVPLVQTSAASVPKPVRVREPEAQTFAGMEVMDEATEAMDVPRDEEAVPTTELVLVFTTAARDEVAAARPVFVFVFIAACVLLIADPIEEVAVAISDCTASEPELRPAPVRVRVEYAQTSAAVSEPPPVMLDMVPSIFSASCLPIEPAVFMVLVAAFQIFVGMEVIEVATDASEDPSELEAAVTTVLVFAFIAAVMELEATPIALFVFAFTAL